MGKRSRFIFWELCRAAGYCCPHEFLYRNQHIRTGLIAELFGLHRYTIRQWRISFKAKILIPCGPCRKGLGSSLQPPVEDDDIFSHLHIPRRQ